MKLSTLVYVSTAAEDFDHRGLAALVDRARTRNDERGITGYLVYDGAGFAQLIEGASDAVDEVYRAIAADPRHHSLRVVLHEDVTQRCFGGWHMGASDLNEASLAAAAAMRGVVYDFFTDRAPVLAEVQAFFLTFAEFEVDARAGAPGSGPAWQ